MATNEEDVVRAMDALRRIVQVLRASALRVEQDVGVSGAQLFVLATIGAEPGQSIGEISDRTATRQSTVSEVVARLVGLRLVSRTRSRTDARRVVLAVTARGADVLARSPTTPQAALVQAFEDLPAATRRSLAAGLERWSRSAGLGEGAPPMLFEQSRGGAGRKRASRAGSR
jgi:DNA-binding MarR family transcriptional regulator